MTDGKVRAPGALRQGWALLILGLLVAGLGGYMLAAIAGIGQPAGSPGFTFGGTAEEARIGLTALIAAIAFGVMCVVNGVFQIATGRRNTAIRIVTAIFAVALFAAIVLAKQSVS